MAERQRVSEWETREAIVFCFPRKVSRLPELIQPGLSYKETICSQLVKGFPVKAWNVLQQPQQPPQRQKNITCMGNTSAPR